MKRLKDYFRKIVPLRHVDTTARLVLERTLDKADRIQAVAIVIKWDDGGFDSDWSMVSGGDLALMALILMDEARKKSYGPK